MIKTDIARDFYLYQQRLAANPNRIDYYFSLPTGPHLIQYHNTGKHTFGAVFAKAPGDPCKNFRAYLPKVELN